MRATIIPITGSITYLAGKQSFVYLPFIKSNRKAMDKSWGNQKANPALKTKTGNK